MSDIGYATLPIIPSLKGARSAIEGELGNEGSRQGERFGSDFSRGVRSKLSLGSIAKGLAVVTAGALATGGALVGIGVKGAASLESTTTSFTALLGSSKAATDQIAVLQQYAAKTPFSQQDVLGYAQQYYALADSIGLSKAQVVPFLDTVGNLGAVTGASTENIHNAVMAIGQIGSSGKLTLENLNQISEAFPGFNGAAAIASATGKSTADVMKAISAGSIDAATGVKALLTGMQNFNGASGAMVKQSATLKGVWSTFTDTVSLSLTKAFQPLIPVIKTALGQLTPLIAQTLGTLAPIISQFVQQLAPIMGPLVKGLGAVLGAVFKALGPVIQALTPIITPLATAFVALVEAVSPLLTLFAQIVGQLGPPLLAIMTTLFQAIMPVAQAFADALAPVLPIIADAIQQVMIALGPLIDALSGALVEALNTLAPQMPDLARAFASLAVSMAKLLASLAPMIGPTVELFTFLEGISLTGLATLAKAMGAIADGMRKIVDVAKDVVGSVKTTLGTLLGVGGPIKAELGTATGAVVDFGRHAVAATGNVAGAAHSAAASVRELAMSVAAMLAPLPALGIGIGVASAVMAGMANVPKVAPLPATFVPSGGFDTGGWSAPSKSSGGGGGSSPGSTAASRRAAAAAKAHAIQQAKSKIVGTDERAFRKGTAGTTAEEYAAFKTLQDDAVKAGIGPKTVALLRRQNAQLIDVVHARNGVAAKLAKANTALANVQGKYDDIKSTVKSAFTSSFNLATAGTGFDGAQPVTAGNILAQVRQSVAKAKRFLALLKSLKSKGLPASLLNQLAQAGPDALPEAEALANATKGELDGIKSSYSSLNSTADQLGKFMADGMYGAGVNSAKGIVKGLESQESTLNKAINKLADSMVGALEKRLDIHSPSRVMFRLGGHTGRGFGLGLENEVGGVEASARSLADAAMPNLTPRPSTASSATTSSADPALVEAVVAAVMAQLPDRIGFDFNGREVARMTEKASVHLTRGR